LAESRTGTRYPIHPYIYYDSELLREFFIEYVLQCIYINIAGDGETQANQWPSFVDYSNMVQHYLTDAGVKATCRVLNVIAHERPDITYSPLLFTLTAILLHYVDEAACYTCVSSLVTSRHRYIAQTMISHQAQTFTVSELASKHVVCILSYSELIICTVNRGSLW